MNEILRTTGFADPVHDAQATFRCAMRALAEPGTIRTLATAVEPPAPLMPATAALLLALADYETPIWLDERLRGAAGTGSAAGFLRFQTGATITEDRARAGFAVLASPAGLAPRHGFAEGTLEYPDRSTTLIIQVEALEADTPDEVRAWTLTGPGIKGSRRLAVDPEPANFVEALLLNHELYPRGIDVFFVAGSRIAGLPRSTRITV